MSTVLDGLWAYTLQGFMHGLRFDKTAGEMDRELVVGSWILGGIARQPIQPNVAPIAAPPLPPAGKLYVLPAIPTFGPPAKLDNTGYYPVSETGYMTLWDYKVEGNMRLNVAGFANGTKQLPFYGEFTLDQPTPQPSGLRMGIISIISDSIPNLFWDYSFTMVSKTEIDLAVAGRVPRPAVMTGKMKKITPSERDTWIRILCRDFFG